MRSIHGTRIRKRFTAFQPLPLRTAAANPGRNTRVGVPAMDAILMVLVFIVAMGALNIVEFGRLD